MKRIPHIIFIYCCAGFLLLPKSNKAQAITYTYGTLTATYAYNTGTNVVVMGELPNGIDDGYTNPYPIGFNFQYGCQVKTQFIASSNGWMTFNMGCIGSDPGNQLAGNATQIANAERPIIAPLWDDLDVGAGGNVNYLLTGTSPNRVLTIEWKKMMWRYSAAGPVISFQVKLYETTNRIDFVYLQESNAVNVGSASAGLTGAANGNYYSLQNFTNVMSVTNNTGENVNLNTKPASHQSYSWSPVCGLPVGFIYFTGKEDNEGRTNFQWATAMEKNNDFFTLEGSVDGKHFKEIKKIKGSGNSNSTKHYNTSEIIYDREMIYFRVKQTDYDHTFSYTDVIAIDEKEKDIRIIYPNPSEDNFSFFAEEAMTVNVYSYTGQLIEVLTAEANSILQFGESYAKGIYFVTIQNSDSSRSYKVIKN